MQVGTTKDQSLYNKPSGAVHPGALAAGTLPQCNTLTKQLGPICDGCSWYTNNDYPGDFPLFFSVLSA